ncbi:hypothetical protein PoB_004857800 [Plakobranchus ocellatus]|uniref:Uncharacterized protein n=1 Tax=Plakobranchus ocellatus TaxID=259542 RepID=A0AAV4BR67_9GAST|nr:hypothetical protein PoB_004857800 [Plakobranchus ocellatus]
MTMFSSQRWRRLQMFVLSAAPEYNSPIFLDCCGLVRQVVRDLQDDLGFRLGPWNQAYMFDTLPVTLTKRQMRPGDLVFMTGDYTNPKKRKQRHNMLHVEIWLGEGDKTIGSRWNNGKVSTFDSYKFDPKSFHNEQYIFKSIDTWLMGICHSYCPKHPWRQRKFNPSAKSIFNADDAMQDEKANPDSDDDNADKDGRKGFQSGPLLEQGEESDGDGQGGGGGVDSSLTVEDVTLDIPANSRISTPGSAARGSKTKIARMPSPRKFKTSLKNRIRATGTSVKLGSKGPSENKPQHVKDQVGGSDTSPGKRTSSRDRQNSGNATLTMDHDAMVLPQSSGSKGARDRKKEPMIGDLSLLRASNRRVTATVVTSAKTTHGDAEVIGARSSPSILREVTDEEIEYIPNRLPSRSSARGSNAWRTLKEREVLVQAREKKVDGEHRSQRNTAAANSITSTGIFHGHPAKNETNDSKSHLSVISSHDSVIPKAMPSPCSKLQSSETNLIFRTNTNFFKAGRADKSRPEDMVPGRNGPKDERCARDTNKTWRLSSRMSPERDGGCSKDRLDLKLVKQKLISANLIDENGCDSDSDLKSDDYSDDELRDRDINDITSCLIIQKSPRFQPASEKSPRKNISDQQKGRKTGGKQAKGFACKSNVAQAKSGQTHNGSELGITGGRRLCDSTPVFLSTSILQSALCMWQGGGANDTPSPLPLPPVDDSSVVVCAGTMSQMSSLKGLKKERAGSSSEVKCDATKISLGICGNRREGHWNNPNVFSSHNIRNQFSDLQRLGNECISSTLQKENKEHISSAEDVEEGKEILYPPEQNDPGIEHSRQLIDHHIATGSEDVNSYPNLTHQKVYVTSNIEEATDPEDEDEFDISDTSFTSDISFDDQHLGSADCQRNKESLDEIECTNVSSISKRLTAVSRPCKTRRHWPGSAVGHRGDIEPLEGFPAVYFGTSSQGLNPLRYEQEADTDDEMESALALTSVNNCYRQMDILSQDGLHDDFSDVGDLNKYMAVTGDYQGYCSLPGNQRLNPAWEWLYSFQQGLSSWSHGEANANNNSKILESFCERGTSICARPEDDFEVDQIELIYRENTRDKDSPDYRYISPLSPRRQLLPPLDTALSQTCGKNRYTIMGREHNSSALPHFRRGCAAQTNDEPEKSLLWQPFSQYQASSLLANYVLNQQPRRATDEDFDEADTRFKTRELSMNEITDVDKCASTEQYSGLCDSLSRSGLQSSQASCTDMHESQQPVKRSLPKETNKSTPNVAGRKRSYFEKLRSQEERAHRMKVMEWSIWGGNSAAADGNNNSDGVAEAPNRLSNTDEQPKPQPDHETAVPNSVNSYDPQWAKSEAGLSGIGLTNDSKVSIPFHLSKNANRTGGGKSGKDKGAEHLTAANEGDGVIDVGNASLSSPPLIGLLNTQTLDSSWASPSAAVWSWNTNIFCARLKLDPAFDNVGPQCFECAVTSRVLTTTVHHNLGFGQTDSNTGPYSARL